MLLATARRFSELGDRLVVCLRVDACAACFHYLQPTRRPPTDDIIRSSLAGLNRHCMSLQEAVEGCALPSMWMTVVSPVGRLIPRLLTKGVQFMARDLHAEPLTYYNIDQLNRTAMALQQMAVNLMGGSALGGFGSSPEEFARCREYIGLLELSEEELETHDTTDGAFTEEEMADQRRMGAPARRGSHGP